MDIKKMLQRFKADKNDASLYGNFGFSVYETRGGQAVRVLRVRKRNQITNEGRLALLNTLAVLSTDPAGQQVENGIWSLAVGTDATPPTILDTDASMAGSVAWRSAFAGGELTRIATTPNSFYLQINKTLGLTDAVGETLAEAGVFTRGGDDDPYAAVGRKLYARQVHSPILKTGTMTIQYDWQLGINIQS